MGVFDDIDNIYDSSKHAMVEKMVLAADEGINNWNYWKHSFTLTVTVIITNKNENNCYHRLLFFILLLIMITIIKIPNKKLVYFK